MPEGDAARCMKRRRLSFLLGIGTLVLCALGFGLVDVALQVPLLPTHIAKARLYGFGIRSLAFASGLSVPLHRVPVANVRADGLTALISNVSPKESSAVTLRGEIETLVLQDLKLTYRLGATPGGKFDLSFLEKLPKIRRLEVRNAEVFVSVEGGPQQVKLTDLNLDVKDFSSTTGGGITFRANFAATAPGDTTIAAGGRIRGDFALTAVHPKPFGKGTVELVVDSAGYARGNRTASLSGLTLFADLTYDQQTETVSIDTLRGESKDFGTIFGAARVSLGGDMRWSAHVSAASIDFARAFAAIRSLVPEAYRTWAVQGQGTAETQAEGTFADGGASLDGSVVFSFDQGGVSSPDGTKAAQGVGGRLALKLAYGSQERKLTFGVRAMQRDGEYLWGAYYNNLAGRRASLALDGEYSSDGTRHFELTGSMDFFQTGEYSFNANGTGGDWALQFRGVDISHPRIVEALLGEYLKGLSPRLAGLSVTGRSSLEATTRHEGGALAITGTYRTDGASLVAPDIPLSIRGITANVPFALRYPPSDSLKPASPPPGFVRFQAIQRRRLTVEDLQIPLVISENTFEVPEPVVVPFFGGKVHLYGLQIDDVLFPNRYRFGLKIAEVDLGRMTRRLARIEIPGTINADLGMMRYENNRIVSEGRALVTVFGGAIEATDLFAENILSPSRRFGGDIAFRNISLEELTRKIPVGKMTGVIQGSLRNFTMEYGEPASFILDVESVPTPGVSQSISVDAIQNISILGTGADSALNRGVTQLFKEYPYRKIGLRSVLKNDQFSVKGTIHDGGKEYLVRRGVLRGVDVVNQNPDNVISFRDMTERIKRISQSPEIQPGGITVE
jgi:hypothetical protein